MNRILAGLLMIFIACYSGICFGNDKAAGERRPIVVQDQADGSKKIYEKKYGPFNIWESMGK